METFDDTGRVNVKSSNRARALSQYFINYDLEQRGQLRLEHVTREHRLTVNFAAITAARSPRRRAAWAKVRAREIDRRVKIARSTRLRDRRCHAFFFFPLSFPFPPPSPKAPPSQLRG